MRACDAERADGTALATPAHLSARCLDAFRAALRQWFYGEMDEMATETPSREPRSRASRALGLYTVRGSAGLSFYRLISRN